MPIDSDLLLVIKGSTLGDGPVDLGEKLIDSFLKALLESNKWPSRIICINSGIMLTTEKSPVEATMKTFESNGVEILSCLTCLEYFGRKEKLIVGKPTTMPETVRAMQSYKKVICP
jgi:selenium metabolism protein YedF